MKIGVDGVLLGSWIQQVNVENILDVGTGSGLIALMLAQKHPLANITAVEIEKEAALQAIDNFTSSKFTNRFNVLIENFLNCKSDSKADSLIDQLSKSKFDIIVANLPYFNDGGVFEDNKRDLARSAKHLPLQDFIIKAEQILSISGSIYFIYPSVNLDQVMSIVKECNLSLETVVDIKGNRNSEVKRCLIKLSMTPNNLSHEDRVNFQREILTIEESRGNYTKQYKELCKDFYLKF